MGGPRRRGPHARGGVTHLDRPSPVRPVLPPRPPDNRPPRPHHAGVRPTVLARPEQHWNWGRAGARIGGDLAVGPGHRVREAPPVLLTRCGPPQNAGRGRFAPPGTVLPCDWLSLVRPATSFTEGGKDGFWGRRGAHSSPQSWRHLHPASSPRSSCSSSSVSRGGTVAVPHRHPEGKGGT